MTKNIETKLHVFTDSQLKEHDMNVARVAADAATIHAARGMLKMSAPQQMQCASDGYESLKLKESTLSRLVVVVVAEEDKLRK